MAACKNSSALLFVSAKVSHLALLPQGGPERKTRALNMVAQMDKEGFGSCTNTGACEAVCPKEISIENIARLNREYMMAGVISDKELTLHIKIKILLKVGLFYLKAKVALIIAAHKEAVPGSFINNIPGPIATCLLI